MNIQALVFTYFEEWTINELLYRAVQQPNRHLLYSVSHWSPSDRNIKHPHICILGQLDTIHTNIQYLCTPGICNVSIIIKMVIAAWYMNNTILISRMIDKQPQNHVAWEN